jgi:hypothetical protein
LWRLDELSSVSRRVGRSHRWPAALRPSEPEAVVLILNLPADFGPATRCRQRSILRSVCRQFVQHQAE